MVDLGRQLRGPRRPAVALALLALLAVLFTLGDPGITLDEPLDVRPGRTYVETLFDQGPRFFSRSTVAAVFGDNAEHPPLGRWLLGTASVVGQPFELVLMGGPDPLGLYLHAARVAPAVCFALLVGLVTHAIARRHGTPAGAASGFALLVMPRVFAHAHLGALDTFITTFWVLALLAAERALTGPRPRVAMLGAGLAWGLALLTKIHAWLLVPVVLAWSIFRLGVRRGCVAFAGWAAVGLALFLAGWPWLWYDPVPRLLRFLGTGVARATIHVTYFGRVYADREVPWHYPWVYFALTVPVGLHLFGLVGVFRAWRDRRADPFLGLVGLTIVGLLALFSTRVPVYDGERLFLMAFPLWALLAGRGFGNVWELARGRTGPRVATVALLVAQGYGVVAFHPFQLSYYNVLAGGSKGAERLGLETTFWGDAVDPVLLDRLVALADRGDPVALAPTLYPGQGVLITTRAMAARALVPRDEEALASARWILVSRRTAYWKPDLRERLRHARRVAERSRGGVWLSALYFQPAKGPPGHPGPELPENLWSAGR